MKKNIYKPSKNVEQFFCMPTFSNIKERVLTDLKKKLPPVFCLPPFPNIKKSVLTSVKEIWDNFFLVLFFKY